MEEEILLVPSGPPETYCRLCFSEADVEPLLVSNISLQSNQALINLIEKYIQVSIPIHPRQSCAICSTCRMMLEEFDRFRMRCLRCDSILNDNVAADCPPAKKQKQHNAATTVELPIPITNPSVCTGGLDSQLEQSKSQANTNGTNQTKSTDSKPYQCSTCSIRFHFIGSLKRHVVETHSRPATVAELKYNLSLSAQTNSSISSPVNLQSIEASTEPQTFRIQGTAGDPAFPDICASNDTEHVNPALSSSRSIMFSCMVFLERLDSHIIPPVVNMEIPLGKFYHIKQKQSRKNASTWVEETVEDEIKRIYPSLKLSKPNRSFICDICSKSMKSRMALLRHKMRHDDIVHPCSECSRLFPDKSSLDRHMPQHTGEFPHPCDQCPLGFARIGLLKKHQERYHGPNAVPLNLAYCSYCPRAFAVQTALSSHIFSMHPSQADDG